MKNARLTVIMVLLVFLLVPVAGKSQESAEGWYKEGLRYMRQENFDKALESFNRSIEIDPVGNPEPYFYRAKVYESLGQYENAAADYLTSCGMGSALCVGLIPNELTDVYDVPDGEWAVGDFGYHIDPEGDNTYNSVNVVDGLFETAWITRDDPSSIFEDMMIGFKCLTSTWVREFIILNGYCKSKGIWEKNSRVKKIAVLIDGRIVDVFTLEDTMDEQIFYLNKDYDVEPGVFISFLILEVYPGNTYNDIAISELRVGHGIEGLTDEKAPAEMHGFKKVFEVEDALFSDPAVWESVVYIIDTDGVLHAVDTGMNEELWRFDSGSEIKWNASPCTLHDGVVYFGNKAGDLYSLDARTGQELWRVKTEGWIDDPPSVVDNVIFFVAGDWDSYESIPSTLYAVDTTNGQELWRFEGEGWQKYPRCFNAGVIYFGSNKNLYAVDIKTGQELWRFDPSGWAKLPTVEDTIVYCGSSDGNMYAVDIVTGQELWRFDTGEPLMYSSPTIADGTAYFGNSEGMFYSLDAHTGQELWRFEAEENGRVKSSPSVIDGVVYFVSGSWDTWFDDRIHALDINSGQQLWWEYAEGYSPVYINNVVYLAGELGASALDIRTGEVLWSFDSCSCTYPFRIDDSIYFVDSDGCLYRVE